MAPSRISDDYVLSLSLDPPVMAEARALAMLPTLIGAWDLTGSGAGLPARKALRGALETQLSALFGPATVPMAAAGLAPPKLDPALKPFALSEMRRIWLTRIRPHLMAQRCADGASGEDCVLLARINLPVMKVGTHWEVGDGSAPVEDSIALDEQERPFVVAGALAASAIGVAAPDEPRPGEYAVVTAAGNLPDTISIAAIRLGAAGIITLAAGAGAGKPRTVWLRNLGAAAATLKVAASGKIDGQPAFPLDPGTAVLLAADGLGNWTRASGGGA